MIDKATVARILDAADIVEVVSDFVSLRRRGVNYVGLCPFHNERTPSFSVSKTKGICHCFSCGKGGSPVNFIMEHEQLSYYEALKYLAKKYHIEVVEKELTDEEKAAQSEREGMLIVNEFATQSFENNLFNTQEGQDIGMSYFYERGFSENIIKKFRLGYSLDNSNDLFRTATAKGYNKKYLFDTGLCIDDKRGGGYDRFKGRVLFPVLNLAGKIIAFSARTLKNDQAKYVNSPESIIYTKGNELYGLYQAKHAIVKQNKCYLVEGNADVVSMHQAGFDNTIASLGTALTPNQVRMIHRFTENVTIMYDGDSAGIKAALKAINLLLPEGVNVRVLLLPDGDDPDSFSKKHNATEFQEYIDNNEVDFIRFMKQMLLDNVKDDPIRRAAVVGDVVSSIALIPFEIQRSIYTKECSELFGVDEEILLREIAKKIATNKQKEYEKKQKKTSEEENKVIEEVIPVPTIDVANKKNEVEQNSDSSFAKILYPYEKDIIRYVVKYGMIDFCAEDSSDKQMSLLSYVSEELALDDITFTHPIFEKIFSICKEYLNEYETDLAFFDDGLAKEKEIALSEGINKIRRESILSIQEIEQKERELNAQIEYDALTKRNEFQIYYLEKKLSSHLDNEVRKTAFELIQEKHLLSKIHSRYGVLKNDVEKLDVLIPQALYNLKDALIQCHIKELQQALITTTDPQESLELLKSLQELYDIRKHLASYLGDRVVNPKN